MEEWPGRVPISVISICNIQACDAEIQCASTVTQMEYFCLCFGIDAKSRSVNQNNLAVMSMRSTSSLICEN